MTCPVARFDIVLDNPMGIYHPGDLVIGRTELTLLEDIPIQGLYLWVLGQSDVSWSSKPEEPRTHFDYEVYMQDCLVLWGNSLESRNSKPSGKCNTMVSGSHTFHFQYLLKETLPSSFESRDFRLKGRIHYMLRAKLISPDSSIQLRADKVFLVLHALDLNKEEQTIKESVQLRKEKMMRCRACCCWCLHSGVMSCSLRLDRTGFVPGEDVNLDAEVQNSSSLEIVTSYVTMQQIVRIQAQGVNQSCVSDIFRISGGKIKSGDSAFYHDIIHIPPLPPSRMEGCSLIQIEYVIAVGIVPDGMIVPIEVSIPITLGTVPLSGLLAPGITMAPSYSRYSHSSGEIEDYTADDYQSGKFHHVYTYFKCHFKSTSASPVEDTNT